MQDQIVIHEHAAILNSSTVNNATLNKATSKSVTWNNAKLKGATTISTALK